MRNDSCKGVSVRGTGPQIWSGGNTNIDAHAPKVSACNVHLYIWCCECAIIKLPRHPCLKSLYYQTKASPEYSDPQTL